MFRRAKQVLKEFDTKVLSKGEGSKPRSYNTPMDEEYTQNKKMKDFDFKGKK